MEMAAKKKDIRHTISARRKTLTADDKMQMDKRIFQNFLTLYHDQFASCSKVYTYISTDYEAPTRQIIRYLLAAGCQVAVPRVAGRQMDFFSIRDFCGLVPGYMGILEPAVGAVKAEGEGLCLVPGLAFDQEGYRVGYGGGYYDRFLQAFSGPAVGICYEWQMMAKIPREDFDIAVSKIITDQHIYE